MIKNPQTLYGSIQSEIAQILGEGWTANSYGNSRTGWKFINDKHTNLRVFYYNADGVNGGACLWIFKWSDNIKKMINNKWTNEDLTEIFKFEEPVSFSD